MKSGRSTWKKLTPLALLVCATGVAAAAMLVRDRQVYNVQRQYPDASENLTFTGAVTGSMQRGLYVHGPDSYAGPDEVTRCAGYTGRNRQVEAPVPNPAARSSFSTTIVGRVGTDAVILDIDVPPPDAETLGLPSRPLTVTYATLLIPAGGESSMGGPEMLLLTGQATNPPGTLTVGADGRTGTIDAWFALNDSFSSVRTHATHVTGEWRCE